MHNIVATILSQHISKQINITRQIWNGRIQNRVAATSNVLAQTKGHKNNRAYKVYGEVSEGAESRRNRSVFAHQTIKLSLVCSR